MVRVLFLWLLPVLSHAAATCPQWSESDARKAITQLTETIAHHDELYFQQNKTEITDAEYDQLKNQLSHFQSCFPTLTLSSSPHKDLRGEAQWHQAFMGSLHKTYDVSDIESFIKKYPKKPLLLQPKIDGIAVELVYDDGRLQAASTRGDGKRGLNILGQVNKISAIPKTIPLNSLVILHGELFARLDLFKKGLKDYASARHFVAGHINRANTDRQAMKTLDFFPWRWINTPHTSTLESVRVLANIGFPWPALYTYKVESLADIQAHRSLFLSPPRPLPFLMDGIVLKVDIPRHKEQGDVASPSWAIAWKFPAQSALTDIKRIQFTIGRSGKITPVLSVDTVQLGAHSVSSVSLGSVNRLQKHNIAVGDTVSIQLQGQATPIFNRVVVHAIHPKKVNIPDASFYTPLSCLRQSPRCSQQFFSRLLWLTGADGLAIAGINAAVLDTLINNGSIVSLADILLFNQQKLAAVGIKNDKASALLSAIERARQRPFETQLIALSLPSVGAKRAQQLSQHFSHFKAITASSPERISEILNSSKAQARLIINYLKTKEVLEVTALLDTS